MDKNLIEKYLYDVVRRLPEKQRGDIEQELRSLIEDMIDSRMEETGGKREECIKAVLEELGSPAKLARSYRGENAYLIGGEYYDSYCFVLKIVLICAGVGILISTVVSAMVQIVQGQMPIEEIFLESIAGIGNIPMSLITVFGMITLIYAIMERNRVKMTSNDAVWTLDKLPEIPYKKAMISRVDSTIELIFMVCLFVLFIYAPKQIGAWFKVDGEMISVSVFNLEIWEQVLPLFLICIVAGFVDVLVKLVSGRYCYGVMIVNIVMNTVSFLFTYVIMKMFPIWNEQFVPALEQATGKVIGARYDILTYFNTDRFTNGILLFVLGCCLLDSGITIYYTLRYGEKKGGWEG